MAFFCITSVGIRKIAAYVCENITKYTSNIDMHFTVERIKTVHGLFTSHPGRI